MEAGTGKNIDILEGQKRPPKATTLALTIACGWVIFVTSYLILWEHMPREQLILNRISWSSGDFVGLAASGLSLYTYYLVQRSSQSSDVLYLQRFVIAFKKAGLEPEQLVPIAMQFKSVLGVLTENPEVTKRVAKAAMRVAKERMESLATLNDEETYEALRSLTR